MFKAIDTWMAKRLFHPVIIKICQKCKCDQHVFAGHAIAVGSLAGFTATALSDQHWIGKTIGFVLFGFIILAMGYLGRAGATGNRSFWRGFNWVFLLLAIPQILERADTVYRIVMWFSFLWAEYALMLDRIPPEEKREEERQTKSVLSS